VARDYPVQLGYVHARGMRDGAEVIYGITAVPSLENTLSLPLPSTEVVT